MYLRFTLTWVAHILSDNSAHSGINLLSLVCHNTVCCFLDYKNTYPVKKHKHGKITWSRECRWKALRCALLAGLCSRAAGSASQARGKVRRKPEPQSRCTQQTERGPGLRLRDAHGFIQHGSSRPGSWEAQTAGSELPSQLKRSGPWRPRPVRKGQ